MVDLAPLLMKSMTNRWVVVLEVLIFTHCETFDGSATLFDLGRMVTSWEDDMRVGHWNRLPSEVVTAPA